ncbi:hypothetical protein GGI02_003536 [Coemansia sp. RSA 2322]|uniref:Uncharacterized protein n=1 Tax=Coemansia thaxteri TaxID=2663907 RepID=A0A9W8EEZ3_9FUNG|nr:hypothetical protein H4R26_003114 [Coemansia thaxteri]KAJ2468957.1 hypothetical protein GGI02_003536 [Coemansia sp. RSA 2322]KAJ2484518.1 hypothetical protein EV174_002369 [Coemansia sp. RSA 2320]
MSHAYFGDHSDGTRAATYVRAYIAEATPDRNSHDLESDDEAGEFDPVFEFTDAAPEKPTWPAAKPQWKLWRIVGSINWPKVLKFTATYVALPFITGVMAGMGEIFANEFMYRWGWRGARPMAVSGRNGRVFPAPSGGEKVQNVAANN